MLSSDGQHMTGMCATFDSQNSLQVIAVLFIASPHCYSVMGQKTASNSFTVRTPGLRTVKFVKTIQLETEGGRCEYGLMEQVGLGENC